MERFVGAYEALGDREVGVIVVSAAKKQPARDNHVILPEGVDVSRYRANPVVLFQHQPDAPVGTTVAIGLKEGELAARIRFAPEGASALADQICSLTKAGVLGAVSIGFEIREAEPLDPRVGRQGGLYISKCEMMEVSIVAVPADSYALVVERSAPRAAMFRALPRISAAAVERAAARLPSRRQAPWSHTSQVYLLQEQRRREEERFSREARRRWLDEHRLCP